MDTPKKSANSLGKDLLIPDAMIDAAYTDTLTKIAAGPRAFDYGAFIDDLRPLIRQAQHFPPDVTSVDSQVFKRWRHEITDLINRIQRKRYSINCHIESRLFMISSYGSSTSAEKRKRFEDDLADTLTELDVLVKNFDKYGDPKASAGPVMDSTKQPAPHTVEVAIAETTQNTASAEPGLAEMKWPEKVTAAWLWKHMPLSAYGVLISAFLAGMAAGNWEPIRQLLGLAVKYFGG